MDHLDAVLIAGLSAIPPTVASIAAVAMAYIAYRQGKDNSAKLDKVEHNTNGLADKAIHASRDAGRAEGIKEEILRKSIVPPTTPGMP